MFSFFFFFGPTRTFSALTTRTESREKVFNWSWTHAKKIGVSQPKMRYKINYFCSTFKSSLQKSCPPQIVAKNISGRKSCGILFIMHFFPICIPQHDWARMCTSKLKFFFLERSLQIDHSAFSFLCRIHKKRTIQDGEKVTLIQCSNCFKCTRFHAWTNSQLPARSLLGNETKKINKVHLEFFSCFHNFCSTEWMGSASMKQQNKIIFLFLSINSPYSTKASRTRASAFNQITRTKQGCNHLNSLRN